ncbi:MAG: hypothetical protein ABIP94_21055 [Planctomycetota bacterium]
MARCTWFAHQASAAPVAWLLVAVPAIESADRGAADGELHKAIETFDSVLLDELPVVASDDPNRLLGRLRRRAINRAYTKELKELRELQQGR